MERQDLQIPAEHIGSFIHQAELALQSPRMKTAYGADRSQHWIHSGLKAGEHIFPITVALEVVSERTKGGAKRVRVFLTDVRPPQGDEISEGGFSEVTPWTEDQAKLAWNTVAQVLTEAAKEVLKPPPLIKHHRGYLYFYGQRLTGSYEAAGWRLSAPVFAEDVPGSIFCEQPFVCERDIAGRSDHEIAMSFLSELEKVSLLLSVFWCTHVYTGRPEHRWVMGKEIIEGQFPTELRQLGFTEPLAEAKDGQLSEAASPEAPRTVDRLNPNDYSIGGGAFIPPSDATELLELFYKTAEADPIVTDRFLAAAKAYHTAGFIATATTTGAIAT